MPIIEFDVAPGSHDDTPPYRHWSIEVSDADLMAYLEAFAILDKRIINVV